MAGFLGGPGVVRGQSLASLYRLAMVNAFAATKACSSVAVKTPVVAQLIAVFLQAVTSFVVLRTGRGKTEDRSKGCVSVVTNGHSTQLLRMIVARQWRVQVFETWTWFFSERSE